MGFAVVLPLCAITLSPWHDRSGALPVTNIFSHTAKSTARVSLAEIFHPWVRWEGPGCRFEGLSLQNLGFPPFGIEVEKQGFQTAWDITGQKLQGVGLEFKAFTIAFRDLACHLRQKTAEWLVRLIGSVIFFPGSEILQNQFLL